MLANLQHPQGWLQGGHWHYLNQTPGKSGRWQNIQYHINDENLQAADFVVVHEDLDAPLKCKASGGNFILVTGEEKSMKSYPQAYVDQFDVVITSRDDIKHPNVVRMHYICPWSVKKTYDELLHAQSVKIKDLSAIISNATVLPEHKNRFAFINKLKGHYKNNLDWFSKGGDTFIHDKWDGLAPYRYSVSVENSSHQDYFTEKLMDCFLAEAFPFYWGCPNVGDFFDDRSYVLLDTRQFIQAIDVIDDAMKNELHIRNKHYILESKRLVLEKYHFIAALTGVLRAQRSQGSKVTKTLKPQSYFVEHVGRRIVKKYINRLISRRYF